ncbi:MAG: hypothetical protein GTN39_01615 [Candidatus Aenigmarchaeota archaeon]|nr:hypothetical protein [Candidatus Aenigmarchaeota archaeon]
MNKTHQRMIVVFLFVIIGTSVLASGVSAGLLSDIFDNIKKWFESSPLGGLFSRPVKRMAEIDLTFYPKNFVLNPESVVNVTSNSTRVSNFKGEIEVNLEGGVALLKESNSPLIIEERIGNVEIHGMSLGSLELKNTKLSMVSGNWTETTESGSLKIYDFLGKALLKTDSIELIGNVSKVSKE